MYLFAGPGRPQTLPPPSWSLRSPGTRARVAAGDLRLRSLLRLSLGLGFLCASVGRGVTGSELSARDLLGNQCRRLPGLPESSDGPNEKVMWGADGGRRAGVRCRDGEPRVFAREVGCAVGLEEVGLQALSDQQGRGNLPEDSLAFPTCNVGN